MQLQDLTLQANDFFRELEPFARILLYCLRNGWLIKTTVVAFKFCGLFAKCRMFLMIMMTHENLFENLMKRMIEIALY